MNLYTFHLSKSLKDDTIAIRLFSSIFSILSKKLCNYPDHGNWYHKKVIPGLYKGDREILCTTIDNRIAGIAILKKTLNEKKICSLYVRESFRNLGIGKSLFEKSFAILETSSPLLSVSDSNYHQLKKLFGYFGFQDTFMHKNKYRTGSTEIVFNGVLEKEPHFSHHSSIDP